MANVIFVKLHSASLEHVFKDQIVKLDARQIQIATSFGMDLSRPFGRSYSFLVWGWMWPFRAHDRCDCEWPRLQYGCLPKRYSKKIMNDATFESGDMILHFCLVADVAGPQLTTVVLQGCARFAAGLRLVFDCIIQAGSRHGLRISYMSLCVLGVLSCATPIVQKSSFLRTRGRILR